LTKEALCAEDAARLLLPADEGLLDATQVSTEVNNARNDGPELVEAV
jgi:putative SOS response-associated peptidase YedK